MIDLIQKLVEHKASIRQLDGPIGIARASGDAARQPGWTPLLNLMAMISLNLGVLNLLPIPIMDGGVILLLIIESIMRRDISLRIKERIYQTAFVFIVLVFVVVIYNDLMKALPGLAQRSAVREVVLRDTKVLERLILCGARQASRFVASLPEVPCNPP
jgi:RIP metalloprotease RseP